LKLSTKLKDILNNTTQTTCKNINIHVVNVLNPGCPDAGLVYAVLKRAAVGD